MATQLEQAQTINEPQRAYFIDAATAIALRNASKRTPGYFAEKHGLRLLSSAKGDELDDNYVFRGVEVAIADVDGFSVARFNPSASQGSFDPMQLHTKFLDMLRQEALN